MGFFSDLFKLRTQPKAASTLPSPYQIKVIQNGNGIRAELIFQNHDVTRILIPFNDVTIAGHQLKDCKVSWYSNSDMVLVGNSEPLSAIDYKSVIAGIDINKILNKDLAYCIALMAGLFKEDRVLKYLEYGEQDFPPCPCGRYIGEINFGIPPNSPPNAQPCYYKNFNTNIGNAAHYTPEMQEHRLDIIRQRQAALMDDLTAAQGTVERIQRQIQQQSPNSHETR